MLDNKQRELARERELAADRRAIFSCAAGAALGVGIGACFNGAAGGGIGFYIGLLGVGGINAAVVQPLIEWCQKRSDAVEP